MATTLSLLAVGPIKSAPGSVERAGVGLRTPARYVLAVAVCATLTGAVGLGLLARSALTDTAPKARIQADVRQLEQAQAVETAFNASRTEVRDLVALNAFASLPEPVAQLVGDTRARTESSRAQLVAELTETRRMLGGVITQVPFPPAVRHSLAVTLDDTHNDEDLLAASGHLDSDPYRDVLEWLSTQDTNARIERAKALTDLAHVPAASSPAGARRLVGIALILAVTSVSFVLLATWRRSRRFERHSSKDVLTDLSNRRQLDRDVTAYADNRVAVLMIDIDHFKSLNDTLGHAAGDLALVSVARCIASTVRAGDLAYRYGGEEFCVLLPDTDLAAATAVAERVRSAVQDLDIDGAERLPNGRLTVSIGVAVDTPRAGINEADQALYAAKNGGRNRIETTAEAVSA
jgi:diguanylate cyclase (GGDEF)-like protein